VLRKLREDETLRPDLFFWNGAIDENRLRAWLAERRLEIPADLFALWRDTGGGDLFETETLLGPFGDARLGDDVDGVNAAYRKGGLPDGHLVVHVGFRVTAIHLSDGAWVAFDRDFHVTGSFASFDGWYEGLLRREYAARYGLPA
jgi:hypothetical protein